MSEEDVDKVHAGKSAGAFQRDVEDGKEDADTDTEGTNRYDKRHNQVTAE